METTDNKEYQRLQKKADKITNEEAIKKMIEMNPVMMPRLKDGTNATEDDIEEMEEILGKKPTASMTKFKPFRSLIYGEFTKEAKKHKLTLPRLFNIPYEVNTTFLNEDDENILMIEEGINESLLNPVEAVLDLQIQNPKEVFMIMMNNLKVQMAMGLYNDGAEYNLITKKKSGESKESKDLKKSNAKKKVATKKLTTARKELRKKVPEKKKVTKEEFEKARKELKKKV